MVSIVDGFGGEFVKIFFKTAPEVIEHEYCRGFASRIFWIREGSSAMPPFCWYWRT